MFDRSTNKSDIFHTESPLLPSHAPESIIGRDQEINAMVETLQSLHKGRSPDHLLVHGPPGVGKTTCVRHVLDRLNSETRTKTAYINCWKYNTRPALLTQLLIKLGYPAPRKGKPVDELLSILNEWLDKNRSIAVALDEFDKHDSGSEIMYDLHQSSITAENDVGLVVITDRPEIRDEIEPRSKSRIPLREVEFQPYTADDIREILQERVKTAFMNGVVPEEVLERIAEEVANSGGDCREALHLLLQAGRTSASQNFSEVKLDEKKLAKAL